MLWRDFVDDTLCWGDGDTVEEAAAAELKIFVLRIIKESMGLKLSLKQDKSVYAEVEFCGLWWSAARICIGEEAVKYIIAVCLRDQRQHGECDARSGRWW